MNRMGRSATRERGWLRRGGRMLCLMFAITRERRTFTPVPLQAG
jgi:hypothetical protein